MVTAIEMRPPTVKWASAGGTDPVYEETGPMRSGLNPGTARTEFKPTETGKADGLECSRPGTPTEANEPGPTETRPSQTPESR